MKKNTLLNIAIVICKFLRLFYFIVFLMLTGLFIHFQVSPSSYENVDFKTKLNDNGISMGSTSYKIHVDGKAPDDSDVFVLNKLKRSSLYFNYLKFTALLLLIYLCVKEFQKVIDSVKEIKTFQKVNVSSFKKIGKYLLIITVLIGYSSFTFQGGGKSGFYIPFTPLVLSLLAYIMAEIFKEGNNLLEEYKLTV